MKLPQVKLPRLRLPTLKAPVIGMDVDRGAIKAVQVSRSGDGYTLRHVGYHRLPEGVISNGEVADTELLSREIREFWDLHEFKGKSVILGVSGNNVIVRFVDFPRLSPEDLESALGFQAEEHIPMPMEDVVLDHIVLGPSAENPDDDHVVLVAAHREMIGGYTDAVRSGGLKPVGVDVKALALTRSTLPESLFDDEDTTLLLDIGTEFSNLVVVQGQMPTHAQLLNIGFQDFINSAAASADLTEDQAEKITLDQQVNISPFTEGSVDLDAEIEVTEPLYIPPFYDDDHDYDEQAPANRDDTPDAEATDREVDEVDKAEKTVSENEDSEDPANEGDAGVFDASESSEAGNEPERDRNAGSVERSGTSETIGDERDGGDDEGGIDPVLAYDIRRGLEDAASRLASEVQRSVEFHNSRPGAREVSRAFISGEGALISGLAGYVEDYMGLPTNLAKPTGRLLSNDSNISDEQLVQMEQILAVALGLAMEE